VSGKLSASGSARVRVASATGTSTRGQPSAFRFGQFHVDVARNSSDDFNPLHDPKKWDSVQDNPFGAPIVSVFQMQCLIEYLLRKGRSATESRIIEQRNLGFCNYHFTFTRFLRAGDRFEVRIQPSTLNFGAGDILSTRVFIRQGGKIIAAGAVRESTSPLCLPVAQLSELPGIETEADLTYIPDTEYFLKRIYLSTANAKNFLSGSLVDQAYYFDEVEDRVNFPDMVPVSFLSSALFEKNIADNVDFRRHPLVHARHSISVDQSLARDLQNNDRLNLLITGPEEAPPVAPLSRSQVPAQRYDCFGLVRDHQLLFRAQAFLVPLAALRF